MGRMSAVGDDVLIQIHIPKCAGTSVALWMRRAVGGGFAAFGSLYGDEGIFNEERLWRACLSDPRTRAVSSHDIRRFPPAIRGRRLHYFTILRHPLANFLSAARYMQQDRLKFGVPESVSNSTRAVTEWILSRPLGEPFRENNQTNHLALFPWCAETNGRLRGEEYGFWHPADQAAYQRDRVALAKRALDAFLVVGCVERLPQSLDRLRSRSAAFGIELPPVEDVERNNVTTVPLDDVSWLHEDLGVRVMESFAADLEVYEYGVKLQEAANPSFR